MAVNIDAIVAGVTGDSDTSTNSTVTVASGESAKTKSSSGL
jgi:hypothetical protein